MTNSNQKRQSERRDELAAQANQGFESYIAYDLAIANFCGGWDACLADLRQQLGLKDDADIEDCVKNVLNALDKLKHYSPGLSSNLDDYSLAIKVLKPFEVKDEKEG